MITLTAFKWVPAFAQGRVRDLRVRWALEEAGIPYQQKLLGLGDQDKPEYRAIQPWGQIPVIEDDELTLFESGAIVLQIAQRSEALSPRDEAGEAKMTQWVIAALNSVEPSIISLFGIDHLHADQAWAKERRPGAEDFVKLKLASLARRLKGREYLEDRFTAGDLMMVTVLRFLEYTNLVSADPVLGPYVARCEARPAFKKALADQLAVFAAHEPQAVAA
jgi:glutathione S-transferase